MEDPTFPARPPWPASAASRAVAARALVGAVLVAAAVLGVVALGRPAPPTCGTPALTAPP